MQKTHDEIEDKEQTSANVPDGGRSIKGLFGSHGLIPHSRNSLTVVAEFERSGSILLQAAFIEILILPIFDPDRELGQRQSSPGRIEKKWCRLA